LGWRTQPRGASAEARCTNRPSFRTASTAPGSDFYFTHSSAISVSTLALQGSLLVRHAPPEVADAGLRFAFGG
jgi:hypothetical protein